MNGEDERAFIEHIEREEQCYNYLAFGLGVTFMILFWLVITH